MIDNEKKTPKFSLDTDKNAAQLKTQKSAGNLDDDWSDFEIVIVFKQKKEELRFDVFIVEYKKIHD